MCQSNIYTLSGINSTIIIWSFYPSILCYVYPGILQFNIFSEQEKIKDLVLDNPVTLTFKAQPLKITSSILLV